jgi:hypothetical protein
MSTITGAVDLSGITGDLFDPDLELRAAVVFDGAVLGSTVLKAGNTREPVRFSVTFEAPFLAGARLPCPVRLLIGPNLVDRELLSIDTIALEVELAKRPTAEPERKQETTPEKADFQVAVGTIKADIELYRCWIFCCRLYTIRGRVVCRNWQYDPFTGHYRFCDSPVPGATVEAYDVDRWFFWYHRDLIKSAVTDVNGNFVIQFRWCCLHWSPWLVRNWALDPELYSRVHELMGTAGLRLPPVPPGPDPDPLYLQEIMAQASRLPNARLLAAPGIVDEPASAETLLSVLPAAPDLAALHVWPWWDRYDCAPDVVFRVTQRCDNQLRVIHTETNAQTRWNIPTTLGVTLLANRLACCLPTCRDPECPECLKVTFVGCTSTDLIGVTAGPPDLRGYGRTPTSDDQPFFGALPIRGGVGSDVDYFKVQVSRDGGPWGDLVVPVFAGFQRKYWDPSQLQMVAAPPPAFDPVTKNGQTVMVTRRHYEALHPGLPKFNNSVIWNDYDTLFIFDASNTGLTPDGLYQLRFVGYSADAADNLIAGSERILPTCGLKTAESVFIRIDNQAKIHAPSTALHPCGGTSNHDCTNEPDCVIGKICINEGTPGEHCIAACDIVRLRASDTVTIHFSATVPLTLKDGHLGGYSMQAEYAVSQYFTIGTGIGTFMADPTFEVGPTYHEALMQGAPRPHWYGGNYKVTLHGSDFPVCCAYILRLYAWKRTTNGCSAPSNVHHNQFEIAFTVLRQEICPDICEDQK